MSIYDIREQIDELEERLKADPGNPEIEERLHTLRCHEYHMEEYYAGIL